MIAERKIAALRLMAAAFLVAGCTLGGVLLTAAPASAQETTPWYMPQAWMFPQMTAPTGQRRPGSYGHSVNYKRSYGSFSTYCYGNCYIRRGTVATSSGAVLFRPVVVLFDQRAYQIVRKPNVVAQPTAYVVRRPAFTALRVSVMAPRPALAGGKRSLQQVSKLQNNFVVQNGVRIIRPSM